MRAALGIVVAAVTFALASPAQGQARADADETIAGLRRERRDSDRLGWYVPDFAKLQTAGWVGTLAVGLGYAAFEDVLNASLMYGFTPEFRAGDNVHALEVGLDVRPLDLRVSSFRIVPVYVGAGLLYGFGREFFTRLPDRYRRIDESYYPPTAWHWSAQLGLEVDYVPGSGRIERHGLYYEVTTLDSYLSSYLENDRTLRLVDVFSSAIGYRCAF